MLCNVKFYILKSVIHNFELYSYILALFYTLKN